VGAVKLARRLGAGHTVVTLLCDGGDRYRSKIWSDAWLKEKNLVPKSTQEAGSPSIDFVGDDHRVAADPSLYRYQ